MGLQFKLEQIKRFLQIDPSNNDLEDVLSLRNEPAELKLQLMENILNFVYHFGMFKDIKPFMESVYLCVKKTVETETDSIKEFDRLLIKNTLTRFIQEYLTYAKLSQKDQVLSYLSDSLQKLQLQPLIINLGLLIKPMYQDEDYLSTIQDLEEIEVTYAFNDETEIQIKKEIDKWLETQNLSLDLQEQLKVKLSEKFENLVESCGLDPNSETCDNLKEEVLEMLNMKLTVLSLMESIPEDEFEPIGIK
ncbi:MAG: hypothetical protein EU548_10350 [Promethearchaeota archaeon]|nr:MAG: hypothetical protein EU548_10350 [Candidatus Lokiarchaeota archaeon]